MDKDLIRMDNLLEDWLLQLKRNILVGNPLMYQLLLWLFNQRGNSFQSTRK